MRISLAPPPGIVSDETTFATPGFYSDGSNVRFWRGRAQTIGGWQDRGVGAVSGVCRNVCAWADNLGLQNVAYGTHSHLMVEVGGELVDITPIGLTVGNIDGGAGPGFGMGDYGDGAYGTSAASEYWARTWTFGNYGQTLIANPRGDTIYQWENDTGVLAQAVTNAPSFCTSVLVTPERQVLAFGCNEEIGGTYNPMCIRGCDIEDITDWTTASDNNAFEHILEGGGRIVTARIIGAYVAVWTDKAVYLGQFIGSADQTYRFDMVAENCGLAGPNCVVVDNQSAYWMAPDRRFHSWQLGVPPQPLVCPISNEFNANFNTNFPEKVAATIIRQFGEVWFFYPDLRDGLENSRYVAFSIADGSWFKGVLARTAAMDSPPLSGPLFVDFAGETYWHEYGATADGSALSWFIRTSDQYMGEAEQRVRINNAWPDFEDQQGVVSMNVYLREFPQGPERMKGPYALSPGARKKDFRAEGRIAALEFSGDTAPSFMRLGKPSFDAVVTGGR